MLFSRRIAFSGTPSSLLPLEMGDCLHQLGDDAKVICSHPTAPIPPICRTPLFPTSHIVFFFWSRVFYSSTQTPILPYVAHPFSPHLSMSFFF